MIPVKTIGLNAVLFIFFYSYSPPLGNRRPGVVLPYLKISFSAPIMTEYGEFWPRLPETITQNAHEGEPMKQKICLSALLVLGLCLSACSAAFQPTVAPALSPLPTYFPKIDAHPQSTNFGRGMLSTMPTYDPNSDQYWQVDLRSYNLSGLDLSNSLNDLMYADFDTATEWPAAGKMPASFDWQRILDLGKDPGLGIRALHQQGITGKGIGIAIIDQPLLVNHQEYAGQLRLYEETDDARNQSSSMHGPAVASIAVGKTVGVAPAADLYFIANYMCFTGSMDSVDFSCLAKSVYRIIEINKLLPADRKIRVLSMSIGWDSSQKGYAEIVAAVQAARDAGIFVVSSSLEQTYGFKFQALGREPLADPNQFDSYEPGLFWAKDFYAGDRFTDRLLVPMDSRTTAGPGGNDQYVFYREGGWSWSIPYLAGMYALAAQVKPDITPDEFWTQAMKTGQTIRLKYNGETIPFGPILDPPALIAALQAK